ncbi:hypothetical protein [Lysobacter sp. F6437]
MMQKAAMAASFATFVGGLADRCPCRSGFSRDLEQDGRPVSDRG